MKQTLGRTLLLEIAKIDSSILEHVVLQHLDEAAWLWTVRKHALQAPHIQLHHLLRSDERIEAHLDGLLVAGAAGWRLGETQLDDQGPGEIFARAVFALSLGERAELDRLLALAEVVPALRPGLTSALRWVQSKHLPQVQSLLASPSAFQRWLGIRCAILQRADIGPGTGTDIGMLLTTGMHDADEGVRMRSLGAAGELGRTDLLRFCQRNLSAAEASCRFWAAWSAAILGDRAQSLPALWPFCVAANPFRERALQLAALVLKPSDMHELLKVLERDPTGKRLFVQSVGLAGSPARVPWLIEQMQVPALARLAGEAFTFITGADVEDQRLNTESPPDDLSGLADDPDVSCDPDEDLAWPEASKVASWWQQNAPRFAGAERYFLGQPVSLPHAETVLRRGYQRQRIIAALQITLLQPGTALFDWHMPASWQLNELS